MSEAEVHFRAAIEPQLKPLQGRFGMKELLEVDGMIGQANNDPAKHEGSIIIGNGKERVKVTFIKPDSIIIEEVAVNEAESS